MPRPRSSIQATRRRSSSTLSVKASSFAQSSIRIITVTTSAATTGSSHAGRCPFSGPHANRFPAAPARLARAIRSRCRGSGWSCRFSIYRDTLPGILRVSEGISCSAATPCSPPDAEGCSRGRRRRWSHRSTSSPRCRPAHASIADTSTQSRTFASRSRSNRKAQRCARVWCAIRRSVTVVSLRFRRPLARRARPIRFCGLPMRRFAPRRSATPGAICPIALRYSRSFAPGRTHSDDIGHARSHGHIGRSFARERTHSDDVRHIGRDLPDRVALWAEASRLEERTLTTTIPDAICPTACPYWPASCMQ